jgi:hypothetical protein
MSSDTMANAAILLMLAKLEPDPRKARCMRINAYMPAGATITLVVMAGLCKYFGLF